MNDDEILRNRARVLARSRSESKRVEQLRMSFERGDTRYAIDKHLVREVARVPVPTPLPLSAAHWSGLTSLHGHLLAVCDLPPLLAESPPEASVNDDALLVVVIGEREAELALRIDRLVDVYEGGALHSVEGESRDGANIVLGALDDGTRVIDGVALLADPRLTLLPTSSNDT
jgi:chemotaxis signal transduction protein